MFYFRHPNEPQPSRLVQWPPHHPKDFHGCCATVMAKIGWKVFFQPLPLQCRPPNHLLGCRNALVTGWKNRFNASFLGSSMNPIISVSRAPDLELRFRNVTKRQVQEFCVDSMLFHRDISQVHILLKVIAVPVHPNLVRCR